MRVGASLSFEPPVLVIVRSVSARYPGCLRADHATRIDLEPARRQHAAYVAALRDLHLAVEELPADDQAPDCCFIEDAAVVTGLHAVATRPGAPSRRAEVGPVAAALDRHLSVHAMAPPGTLDGGDVLRIGARLFVGRSSRTNAAGVAALTEVAALDGLEVVTLEVRSGLHLKSACALASPSVMVFDPRALREAELGALARTGVELVAVGEPAGANVLALGDAVLVSAAAPATAADLRRRGLDVRVVDVTEFHKGDGALTCLSVRLPRGGSWCA